MHPRCDESSLVRHWRMARHTVRRSSSPSFWKVCAHSRLIANGKNEKFETTDAENVPTYRETNYLCISRLASRLHRSYIFYIHIFNRLFVIRRIIRPIIRIPNTIAILRRIYWKIIFGKKSSFDQLLHGKTKVCEIFTRVFHTYTFEKTSEPRFFVSSIRERDYFTFKKIKIPGW